MNRLSTKILFMGAVLLIIVVLAILSLFLFAQEEVSIEIETTPPGALVTITDLNITNQSPLVLNDVSPGDELELIISLPGYKVEKKTIVASDEKTQKINIPLQSLDGSTNIEGPQSEEVPLVATPNPTYTEKLRREPFWNQLPYWSPSGNFVLEYRDSGDYILITTFANAQQSDSQAFERETAILRQEALAWLRSNGANTEGLTIRYNSSNR